MLRRAFLSRFTAVSAAVGLGGGSASASTTPEPGGAFTATKHSQDEWLDQLPGGHRVVFDTFMAERFREAVAFAGNYVRVNKDAYGLTEKDFALVIVARHHTAPFAFNDAMWAKYGKYFSTRMSFVDPQTKEAPRTNLYATQVSNLVKGGVHLAVCALTTRAYTRIIGDATGADPEEVFKELASNTLGNSHFVPAGIVAVTRAQERGYVLASIGG